MLVMSKKIKSLAEVLDKEKAFEKIRNAAGDYAVVDKFGEIFPEFKNFVFPVKVSNNLLYLRVENSVWKSELNFQKAAIVKKINKYFKKEIIKSIKFTS